MPDLVPIKSFASLKGSKPERANPRPDSQRVKVERFGAIDYARRLEVAQDGSKITSTEKNVLLHLALYFNPEVGIAWPRVETLAKEACISDRHCRRILESLERKKVIQRVPMRRDGNRGQTSNEYFFPALGSPPQTPEAKARRLEIQKVSRTPMTPTTGRRGRTRPRQADTSARPDRTNATERPGRGCPPIESLGDCSIDFQSDSPSEAPAVRSRAANVQPTNSPKTISNSGKAPLADLGLARIAWNSALDKLHSAHIAKELKKYRLRDVAVDSAVEDYAGTVHLTLRSSAPEKAEAGIASNEVALANALCAFYGCPVKLRVIGHERASAPPDQPSEPK